MPDQPFDSATVSAVVEYLRERAQIVRAVDGMYGAINAANQLEHEADVIAEKFGSEVVHA
jgi:hypothetical protein